MGGHVKIRTRRGNNYLHSYRGTLEELRELVQEGVDGDLDIEGISFEEVFLTNSKATN